ncbi:MAG: PAS domain-containing protein [Vicinamibacterales bacterium]
MQALDALIPDIVVEATGVGIVQFDPAERRVSLSARARTILGLSEGQDPSLEHLLSLIHPDDRTQVEQAAAALGPGGSGACVVEHRIVWPNGATRWLRSHAAIVDAGRDGGRRALLYRGAILDITPERQTLARAEHVRELTAALAKAVRASDVIDAAVELGGRALGASGGAVALLVDDGRTFEMVAGPGISPHVASEWQRYAREPQLPASRALATGQPCYSHTREEYVAADPRFAAVADALDIQADATLPLLVGDGALGVISFIFREPQRFADADDVYLRTVAEQCAQALERARLFEAEHASREALAGANAEARAAADRVQLALAAGAIVGTWDWDLVSGEISVDEQFAENFGLDPALGRTGLSMDVVIATVHPDDLPGLRQAILDGIARGGPYSREYRVRRLDGTYRWIQANGRVDHAADGTPVRFPGVLLDVERRRALEAERDRANQLLRAFVDAVPGVVYAKDREGRMLVANRGVTELIGKPPEAYLGKTDLETLEHKEQAAAIMATDRRIMDGGITEALEEEVSFPDGRRAVWLSTKAPFRDADGNVIGLIGSSLDITARKDAEQALIEAGRRRNEFLAMLGHELRNPLAPIVTALKLMELKGGDTYQRERAVIARQATHLSRLVDDLLDVSRFLRGKIEIRREPTDVAALVRQALDSVGELLAQYRHTLDVHVPPSLIVYGDPTRLTQLMVNLLTNAAKYTPLGGRIGVEVRQDEGDVELRVSDTGIGMTPEFLRTVFEPFTQAPQSLDRKSGGLGLGLSIVRIIAAAHDGTVVAHSDGEGQGSTFTVRLALPLAEPGRSSESVAATRSVTPRRVLVVDDNVDAADSLAAALELSGHATQVAYDAASALDAAATFLPDVALLDLGLPGVDGFELAQQLRAQPSLARLIVLAVSGYGQESDRQRTREAGFDAHFTKPVALDALLDAIDGAAR